MWGRRYRLIERLEEHLVVCGCAPEVRVLIAADMSFAAATPHRFPRSGRVASEEWREALRSIAPGEPGVRPCPTRRVLAADADSAMRT